jgi:peptidoglycan hydrolase CwlO-like protein
MGTSIVFAETVDEIKDKIDKRNIDIANLEKEIANYQKQIDVPI